MSLTPWVNGAFGVGRAQELLAEEPKGPEDAAGTLTGPLAVLRNPLPGASTPLAHANPNGGANASPRTNGFVERMNRTPLQECFRVTGRTTWYLEPEEIQRDLDRFLAYYNLERSHQGYRLKGRTPAQALREALGIEDLPPIVPTEEEATEPAA